MPSTADFITAQSYLFTQPAKQNFLHCMGDKQPSHSTCVKLQLQDLPQVTDIPTTKFPYSKRTQPL